MHLVYEEAHVLEIDILMLTIKSNGMKMNKYL